MVAINSWYYFIRHRRFTPDGHVEKGMELSQLIQSVEKVNININLIYVSIYEIRMEIWAQASYLCYYIQYSE